MTSETERKRAEAQAARERLVGTVSELGTAVKTPSSGCASARWPPCRTWPAVWA